ncbi:MAG: hypothetical protein ABL888_00405 [Pirellulaceae bacterium]
MLRVIMAGIVGGLLLFVGGAASHMGLELEGRTFRVIQDESAARDFFNKQAIEPGIYGFPAMSPNFPSMSADEQTAEWERVGKLYKEGPAVISIVAPRGEEMMSGQQLGGEAFFNILAALVVAFVASHFSDRCRLLTRWSLIVLIGVSGWLALSTSLAVWYRFPWSFTMDGLYVVLIEWAMAGLAIALIVPPYGNQSAQAND